MAEVYQEAQAFDEVYDCQMITKAKRNADLIANPIYKWTAADIWEFIRDRKITTCALYNRGYDRVGCIGCPLAGEKHQIREFNDFPKYKAQYIRTFQKLENFKLTGYIGNYDKTRGEIIFDWWIRSPEYVGQISFDNMENQNTETAL